jgi:hypothetical protein
MSRRSQSRVPPFGDVLVIALGAQRIARAISTDEITAPIRERLDRWAGDATGTAYGPVAQRLSELVRCPVCTGWWTSLAMSAMWPGTARMRRGISVAGLQVIFTLLERLLSERGRASIHEADIGAAKSRALAS